MFKIFSLRSYDIKCRASLFPCIQPLLLTVLLQKHTVVSLERHLFCIALHSVQISHFQDHIKQNNDQPFPEVLFTSRLNAFLFSIYFLFKPKRGANACFIHNVWYLFLSIFQSYFLSISFTCILIINETLYGKLSCHMEKISWVTMTDSFSLSVVQICIITK